MKYFFPFSIIIALLLSVQTVHGKVRKSYLEIKNRSIEVIQDLGRGGAICYISLRGKKFTKEELRKLLNACS